MALPNANKLLVEGDEDKRVIPYLIEENGIPWTKSLDETIVDIKKYNGIDEMLKPRNISTELKARNLPLHEHILDPKSPHAGPFVAWFRRLYAV